MFEFLRKKNRQVLKESADSLPPSIAGSQKSLETEQGRFFSANQFGFLIPPFDLNCYLDLYVTDSLSKAIVDADVNLTVSPFEFQSDSDAVNDYLAEFHERLGMDAVVWELTRDVSLFGFCCAEIVGNASTLAASNKIIAIRRIDPRFVVLQKTKLGRILFFRQRPSPLQINYQTFTLPLDVQLEPETIIYVSSLSPLTSYGQSILQSLKVRIKQRNELIAATIKSHQTFSSPVIWLKYLADPEKSNELKDEVSEQLSALDRATKAIDENGTRWLFSGGIGEFASTILGPSEIPDSTSLLRDLTQEILSSAGFSPDLFGLGQGSKNIEGARYSINSIATRQNNIMSALHASLYSKLPFIEAACPANSAEEIKVAMQAPTAESVKEGLEAEAIRINNSSLKLKSGLISPQQFAKELGYKDIFAKELNANFANTKGEVNQNDPNSVQQIRASLDGKGGNNPAGGSK